MQAIVLSDLTTQVVIPEDGIISRTMYQDEQLKAVLFGFAAGQELSEHTASTAAILHIVQGEAHITLDGETREVGANTWIHMPPRMSHSIVATTPLIMVLLLLK